MGHVSSLRVERPFHLSELECTISKCRSADALVIDPETDEIFHSQRPCASCKRMLWCLHCVLGFTSLRIAVACEHVIHRTTQAISSQPHSSNLNLTSSNTDAMTSFTAQSNITSAWAVDREFFDIYLVLWLALAASSAFRAPWTDFGLLLTHLGALGLPLGVLRAPLECPGPTLGSF